MIKIINSAKFLFCFTFAFIFASNISIFSQEQEEINILFIGNSFTTRHDLIELVKNVFEEGKPGLTVNVDKQTYGGQSLFQHYAYYFTQSFIEQSTISTDTIEDRVKRMKDLLSLEESPEEFVYFWNVIRGVSKVPDFPVNNINTAINRHKNLLNNLPGKKWDYIVLQSWQDVSLNLNEGYAEYVANFADIARAQGSQVILYITAPNIQNPAPVSSPQLQERVDTELQVGLQLAGLVKPAAVVHVPLAINMIQKGGTDLTFCYENDFHPNQRAAYLTSNMFYAAFFNESTEGFNFNTVTETKTHTDDANPDVALDPDGGPATVIFEGEEKTYLQQMAFEGTLEFNRLWAEYLNAMTEIDTTLCFGKTIFAGGELQSESGLYVDTFTNATDGDSIVVTNLMVLPQPVRSIDTSICYGKSYYAGGVDQIETGTYFDILTDEEGCKSKLTTNLTIEPITITEIDTTICFGETLFLQGDNQSTLGTYYDTLVNEEGCKSLLVTNLQIDDGGLNSLHLASVDPVIYPNPCAVDELYIRFNSVFTGNYSILNYTGRTIINEIAHKTLELKVNMSDLITGVYFIKLNSQFQSSIHRVLRL